MTDGREATTLGRYLRTMRANAGASLADMARETRISEGYLRALEADRFFELPAPVFVKGFIRAHCEYVGASTDKALALYARTLGVEPSRQRPRVRSRSSWVSHPIVVSGTMVAMFGGGLLGLTLAGKRERDALSAMPAVHSVAGTAPTSPVPGASGAGPVSPTTRSTAEAGGQRLVVKALEPTWVRVQTDEGPVAEEILQAGATREWTSGKRFVLSAGNAGGIQVELNGRLLPSLGARGAVIRQLSLPDSPAGS